MEPHHHLVLVVAALVALAGATVDWRKGDIPHWLTLPALGFAPLLHVARYLFAKEALDTALYEGAYALGGAALSAIVPLLLYRKGALGGGDVKLLVALGAILQPLLGVESQMYGFFAGALLAPAKLAYDGKLLGAVKNAFTIGANWFLPASRQRALDASALTWFRFGPAIFIGVLLTAYLHW
jgi:prepilin peptidase CpaA